MLNLKPESKIKFHDLHVGFVPDEKKHVAIVNPKTDRALRVDQQVIQIFNILTYGKSLQETATLVNRPLKDIEGLMKLFENSGFIKEIDGVVIETTDSEIKPWLVNVPRKYFKWLVKPFTLLGIILFIISGLVLGATMPQYYPYYTQFFWTENRLVMLIVLFVMELILISLHEGAHFLATKAVGGEASMNLNHRAIFIVAETKSYYLSLVTRFKRNIVYLAGMVNDAVVISLCYIVLFLGVQNIINIGPITVNFLLIIILLEIKSIVWQLNVAIKTDLYNVVSDNLGHRHLRENTLNFIRFKLTVLKEMWKTLSNPFSLAVPVLNTQLQYFRENELSQIKAYTKFLVLGFILIYAQFIIFVIPRDVQLVTESGLTMIKAFQVENAGDFISAFIVISLIVFQYSLLTFMVVKNKSV